MISIEIRNGRLEIRGFQLGLILLTATHEGFWKMMKNVWQ